MITRCGSGRSATEPGPGRPELPGLLPIAPDRRVKRKGQFGQPVRREEGEFAHLSGDKVGADRLDATRRLASGTGATVLLKGSTTVVADPDGRVLLSATGDPRLASAGTGDVLSGVIGAFLAQGLDGLRAAAAGAWVHGAAAHLGWRRGFVAGDLLDLLPAVLSTLDSQEN